MEDATPAVPPWPSMNSTGRSPFGSLSSSLGKTLGGSADNLMAMAADAERKIKSEGGRIKAEWHNQSSKLHASIHKRLQFPAGLEDWPHSLDGSKSNAEVDLGERRRIRMRRVRTFGDFRRGSWLQTSHEHEEGRGWDLAAAVNNALSRRPTPGPETPLYLVPVLVPSLKDQQARILHSDTARKVLNVPKESLRTAKQTLENCQENLQTLGNLLHKTVALAQSVHVQSRMIALEVEAMRPLGSHNSSFATKRGVQTPVKSNPLEAVELNDLVNLEVSDGSDEGADILRSWFAGFLRSREIAEIDKVIQNEQGGGGSSSTRSSQPEGTDRPMGPLQREALRRRQEQQRRKRSSLREPGRKIAIYTTASLPWMTGTAVNPLLRAAYLAKDKHRDVTLCIPWLAPPDQAVVFPNIKFDRPEQQEEYVREWARKRTGLACDFKIKFYPGRYAIEKCSILPVGDPTSYIPDNEADVAILEEPEHLNWYHHGRRWTDKFQHVVGIIHTNYLDYAAREEGGAAKAKAMNVANQIVCRMHCHKVVKLSDAVQELPRSVTEFVHGVPESFLKVGESKAKTPKDGEQRFSKGAYFIGKAIWAKGYTELLDLVEKDHATAEMHTAIDCYGYGDDLHELKATAAEKKLPVVFHGARDHLDPSIHEYRVFVNPSTSDVVATTTAEALAMGKWVVVADLPCNKFFKQFSNCLTYQTSDEFSSQLKTALANDPHPMKADERRKLTWEDATERFLDVAELKPGERPKAWEEACDKMAWNAYNSISGLETVRVTVGAGTNTRDNPLNLAEFVPSKDAGGVFDNKLRGGARTQKAA